MICRRVYNMDVSFKSGPAEPGYALLFANSVAPDQLTSVDPENLASESN